MVAEQRECGFCPDPILQGQHAITVMFRNQSPIRTHNKCFSPERLGSCFYGMGQCEFCGVWLSTHTYRLTLYPTSMNWACYCCVKKAADNVAKTRFERDQILEDVTQMIHFFLFQITDELRARVRNFVRAMIVYFEDVENFERCRLRGKKRKIK